MIHRCNVSSGGHLAAAHHRAERAGVGVVAEQRLGHLRLNAEHVDQESQSSQVAGQAIKHARLGDALGVDLSRDEPVDVVAYAQQRSRGVIHAQYRQHAAHRRQMVRNRDQHRRVCRVAEELVDQVFGLRQTGPQLLNDAAHGLAVGHAAVQLFHPFFEGVGGVSLAHRVQAFRQTLDTIGLFRMVEVSVFQSGLDIQQAGSHFHGHRWRRRGASLLGLGCGLLQLDRKNFSQREQALERFTHQREGFRQRGDAVHLASRDRRPGLLGRSHALARLENHGRIGAAQRADAVVDCDMVIEAVRVPHSGQAGCLQGIAALTCGDSLCAKEKQVLRQALRHIGASALQRTELGEQP